MRKQSEFWNKEYRDPEHLALSTNASEDLEKFTRFLERREGKQHLNPHALAVDMGCGNGRNLVYLSRVYGIRGVGYDISEEAIKQAVGLSGGLQIAYETRSIEGDFADIKDGSAVLVLDMMTSHFLKREAREHLVHEIVRILRPGGWLFFKSFLGEGDLNAKRMLKEHPVGEGEDNAYMHPKLGVYEYVWRDAEAITDFFEPYFEIHKIDKSHRHLDRQGRANKRRTVSVYLQKF
ncbi:MAG: class I SAM-dependent methyltransferase [Nitrososphaera sp.]|nr:class I SAM-dependent methyltransferase [Nitrososphaera sp.]